PIRFASPRRHEDVPCPGEGHLVSYGFRHRVGGRTRQASLIQNSFPSGSANIANAPEDVFCAGFVNRTPFASRAFASAITSVARNPIPVFPFSRGFVSQRWSSVPESFAATVTQCPSLSRTSKPSFSRH